MLELCIMVIYLVSYFCKALHSRTNGFLYWYSCIPSCIYSRYSIRAQVFTLQVRHQTHAHSFDYSLYHTFPWYYLTSGLNCIVHWTICQDIYLCPWSCIYSTCWWLYLESFFFSDTSHLFISVIHASCAFSLHYLDNPKSISLRLIINKYHALMLSSYIFSRSLSYSASSYLGIFHFFVNYLNIPLCLAIALFFYFHSSNLS